MLQSLFKKWFWYSNLSSERKVVKDRLKEIGYRNFNIQIVNSTNKEKEKYKIPFENFKEKRIIEGTVIEL